MKKKVINIACAVVKMEGKTFCAKRLRKGPHYIAEHWEFPGGKVEANETPKEALRREIKEELDWEITMGEEIGEIIYEYPDFTIALKTFACTADNKNYKLLEHLEAKWLFPEELLTLQWTAADEQLIKVLSLNTQ